MIFVGDDWSEAHHDVELQDEAGTRLARARLPEGVAGVAAFHELIGDHVEFPGEVAIGIETDRGLWVQAMVAAGYEVYAINPFAASRYRDRHSPSGAKSDPGDAAVLASIVRTDRQHHRIVAGDTALAEGIKVLARAHQNLVWSRQREARRLRALLRDFYPAALSTFEDLTSNDSLAVLAIAPSPTAAATLSVKRTAAVLRSAGRQRGADAKAAQIVEGLRADQLQAPDQLVQASASVVAALVAVLTVMSTQLEQLDAALADHFEQHPDAAILHSLPGLRVVLGARVLAEFGDDPNRYRDAKSRRNYAGTSPITKASGTRRAVLARVARNRRLATACHWWAFNALQTSPGARAFYDARRARGQTHNQALRALANRLVGILHGCLQHHQPYDEERAWANLTNIAA
jgi:Transposase/Transposase IS116/IS110/IS902 family